MHVLPYVGFGSGGGIELRSFRSSPETLADFFSCRKAVSPRRRQAWALRFRLTPLIAAAKVLACFREFQSCFFFFFFGGGGGAGETSIHMATLHQTSVFTAFLPGCLMPVGQNARLQTFMRLARRGRKLWHLQHLSLSLQHIHKRSQAFMPLAKMPPHWYLQRFCRSVHIFLFLQPERCAQCLRPKEAFMKQGLFWVRFARIENIAVRSVLVRANTNPMAAVANLNKRKTRPANTMLKNREFSTCSCVRLQNDTRKTRGAPMNGVAFRLRVHRV